MSKEDEDGSNPLARQAWVGGVAQSQQLSKAIHHVRVRVWWQATNHANLHQKDFHVHNT